MADTPSLEDRVAALEMTADIASFPSSWQELTEAEKAGFIAAIAEARQRVSYRILNAPLTPDEVRQLLRECVTVVKPGEVLFFRCLENWTSAQVGDIHEQIRWWLDENAPSVRVMMVPDMEMAVIEAGEEVPGAA